MAESQLLPPTLPRHPGSDENTLSTLERMLEERRLLFHEYRRFAAALMREGSAEQAAYSMRDSALS